MSLGFDSVQRHACRLQALGNLALLGFALFLRKHRQKRLSFPIVTLRPPKPPVPMYVLAMNEAFYRLGSPRPAIALRSKGRHGESLP